MTTAFQSNAFQNNAFQIDATGICTQAFQIDAFQTNAFQTCVGQQTQVVTVVDRSDGKPRRHTGDDELTEGEVQWMQRKLRELKNAKTEREKAQAAKALEIALAQAAQDDRAAEVISAQIQDKRPEAVLRADYGPVMRDVALLTSITRELDRIVKEAAAHQRMLEDEEDIEMLLL